MSAYLLSAAEISQKLYSHIRLRADDFKNKYRRPACLATVLVGEDPASQVYVSKKGQMCKDLGLGHKDFKLSEKISQKELIQKIKELNAQDDIDGILVQSPLPRSSHNNFNENEIFDLIDPLKDVDCFSPHNIGLLSQGRGHLKPCTPAGVMELLVQASQLTNTTLKGKNSLIIGRSNIVGKPMSAMLLAADTTVTIAHSQTTDLSTHISHADIVVACVGKPHFLNGNLPWKKSAIVIDVGINRFNKKLVGDVDTQSVQEKVAVITPVPGGVGPMTIAMLMRNTVEAAWCRLKN